MDSRLKRHCILGSMGVILLVALLVLYANRAQQPSGEDRQPGSPQPRPDPRCRR